ncbi:LysR family transcriptional regulator [Flavobacterium sp. FlaQc-47]|uniref:LysR family transcriptional regulator n=1 Tax=Flavobacterium sp. FlaQc-47 TaxID=3374180 RepID=UPI003757231A
MDIQQLKYFLALANELHFWNTAEKMSITQSALSRHIMSLESELGLQLFVRNKRNVKLTPAGEFLKEKWKAELIQFEAIQKHALQIHLGQYGTVSIAHPDSISSFFLPDFIKKIYAVFPKLKIELLQLTYEQQEEYLKNYKIDLAFSREENQSPLIGSKNLFSENLCMVVPIDHHFKTTDDVTNKTLLTQKFILTTGGAGSSYDSLIAKVYKHYQIDPHSHISCEFGSTIIPLIRNGLGISILPQSYDRQYNNEVRFIPLAFTTSLYINWRKDDPNTLISNILELIL